MTLRASRSLCYRKWNGSFRTAHLNDRSPDVCVCGGVGVGGYRSVTLKQADRRHTTGFQLL